MKGKEKGMKVERNGDGKEERRQRNVSGEKGGKDKGDGMGKGREREKNVKWERGGEKEIR